MHPINGGLVTICLLNFASVISGQGVAAPKKEKPVIECRIVVKAKSIEPGETLPYEVEIKNISEKEIDLSYLFDPVLEFLELETRDPDGTVVRRKCRDHLAPQSPTPIAHVLKPGATIKAIAGRFRDTPDNMKEPGVYRITATFEKGGIKAVSPVAEIELKKAK